MRIIVGLGNPGEQYKYTRHNAGFLALDEVDRQIAKLTGAAANFEAKFNSQLKTYHTADGNTALLIYPQTFMNDSGIAVRAAVDFYKLQPADVLVLHDEVDLPLGTFKFTENSGSAGHNGIKSVIERLGTQQFPRIRIGIESRSSKDEMPTDAFVLQKFLDGELQQIPLERIAATALLHLMPNKTE